MSDENQMPLEKEKPITNKSEEMIVISKVTFNYVLIAVTFLVVGIAIGLFGLNRPKSDEIDELRLRAVMQSVLADMDFNRDVETSRFALVDDDPYLGDEDAPIVIIEFSDFFCTYCKRHFDQTFVPLLENYGEHIRYVYRDYPQLTAESQPAAMAAQCAYEQDEFWDFHNDFFNNQQVLGRDFYIETAEKYGLDMDAYIECLDSERYYEETNIDWLDGQLEGVRGTPGFFVNGQFVSGAQPYVLFERLIQKELMELGIEFKAPVRETTTTEAEAVDDTESTSTASESSPVDVPEDSETDLSEDAGS